MAITLNLTHPLTDEEFLQLSERNPGYRFERTAEGRLVVTPTGGNSGRRSLKVAYQLERWNEPIGLGVVFDSSTGFRLPDGSLFSPDASWVRRERWEALTPEEQEGFVPLCPDAVFEVRSKSDTLAELRGKMQSYIANGAGIAVLIDPDSQTVEVYRPGQTPERYEKHLRITLAPELQGLVLDLGTIFE